MKWLLTVNTNCNIDQLASQLRDANLGQIASAITIPLGDNEVVVNIEAPSDAESEIRNLPNVIDIYPDSDLTGD
ncbi:hypothetical protein [Alteromonas sp. RKMC-009]|uniref:hypothetical protein n=1 Tax=Alteromonas sp. RKMC-009 TaxID=2267264 RepID=UPI000E69F1A2|nr:hypothetical protein [Alteromonas sp. RKMC-009]AYA64941.1 hypothetical protein DS731_13475 [Alteromonas sp. RKMC-009]